MAHSRILRIVLSLATVTVASFAAAPVARVIGAEPVDVNGISVPAKNYTPVSIGDEITTGATTAVVQFRDGTNMVLQPHSSLKIGGQPSNIQVQILKGAAKYDLTPASRISVEAGKADSVRRALATALPDPSAMARPAGAPPDAVVYRSPTVHQPGAIVPSSAVSVAPFSSGTFHPSATTGGSASIVTPSGLTINVSPVTNTSGVITGYTVTSITTTVTEPNGTTVTIQITSGSLVGDTVSGLPTTGQGGTTVTVQFTPPGSTTPLTPGQAGQAVQTGLTQAVTTGTQNGTLQPGTQPPTPSPVGTGQFSGSGS